MILLLLLVSKSFLITSQSTTSKIGDSKCELFTHVRQFKCFTFETWSEFNLLIQVNVGTFSKSIHMKPKRPLVLTNEINMNTVINSTYMATPNYSFAMDFLQLKGIDEIGWSQESALEWINNGMVIVFQQSLVDFYLKEKPASEFECAEPLIPENETTVFSFFRNFFFNDLNIYNRHQTICP
jgi:hypothetical protein